MPHSSSPLLFGPPAAADLAPPPTETQLTGGRRREPVRWRGRGGAVGQRQGPPTDGVRGAACRRGREIGRRVNMERML
jgi:hypothetical protein